MMRIYKAMTIAGSDSGGGAGIQADLKTFAANGVYGTSVLTAITAQNTQAVTAVQEVSPEVVLAQMEAVFHGHRRRRGEDGDAFELGDNRGCGGGAAAVFVGAAGCGPGDGGEERGQAAAGGGSEVAAGDASAAGGGGDAERAGGGGAGGDAD